MLSATVLGLLVAGGLAVVGVEDGPSIGLVVGVLTGLFASGFVAGRSAPIVHRFHGSLAGLAVAGVVVAVARLGGSPAPLLPVLLMALLGIVLGGIGGLVGRKG